MNSAIPIIPNCPKKRRPVAAGESSGRSPGRSRRHVGTHPRRPRGRRYRLFSPETCSNSEIRLSPIAHKITLVLAIALSTPALSQAQQGPPKSDHPARIEPDARYQAAFEAVASAANTAQLDERLKELEALAGGNHAPLVEQLLHYLAHTNDPRANPVAGLMLKRLDVPAHSAVAVLAPQLSTADAAIVDRARELLRHYEDRSAGRPPDFSGYRAFVESQVRARREPSYELVRFMYDSDPGVALLTLMRGYQLREPGEIRPILWAEHVVADLLWRRQHGFLKPDAVEPAALEQLSALLRHRDWWVRVYVLEMLRRHPELRTEALVQNLQKDDHPRIRGEASDMVADPDSTIDQTPPGQSGVDSPGRP